MTTSLRHALLPAALLLALPAVLPGPNAQPRHPELDSVLTALHRDGLFTGILLVAEDGEAVYRGVRSELGGQPLTPRTPLPLASVTKPLTATAVLSAVADGLIDLDAPVGRYLEGWPYDAVTVRHLLNQTSGVHFLTTVNAHADTTRPVTNDVLLDLVAAHRPGLTFAPGSAFAYDNANFVALASVLEAVTGHPYAEVLRSRVLEPAGMVDASASPRARGDAGWLVWEGAGGVVASAEDLLAFDRALRRGALLPPALLDAAWTRPTLADGSTSRYGFGWFLYDEPVPMVGHFGDGQAAKTALLREVEGGTTTFILLMPGDAIQRTAILGAVMDLWHGRSYDLPKKRPIADVPEAVLARYVGVYDSTIGRLHITLEDGQLHLEPEGAGGSEPLIPASQTVFYFGHQDLTWEFVLDASGEVTGLMLHDHPGTLGEKVR